MTVHTAETTERDLIDARHAALRALDLTVRAGLAAVADRWPLAGDWSSELTAYDRIYPRTRATGGHWTLFSAGLTDAGHEVAMLTVSVEFDGPEAVDLRVHGAREVVAGACSPVALAEALAQSGGPLRQVTPLGADVQIARFASALEPLLAGVR